jgi:Peptidase family M23
MRRALTVLASLPSLLASPVPAHGWRWPVDGVVATRFRVGPSPYAAGQHRGIDILAPAGSRVRSACTGRVRFAGRVGSSGLTVAVVCGSLTTTYVHLGGVAVRTGTAAPAGAVLGTVGSGGEPRLRAPHVQFGVRRTAQRSAYLDPLALLPPRDRVIRRPPPAMPWRVGDRPTAPSPRAPNPPAPRAAPFPAPRPEPAAARRALGRAPASLGPAPSGRPVAVAAVPHGGRVRPRPPAHAHAGTGALAVRLGVLLAGIALPSWGGLVAVAGRRRRAAPRGAVVAPATLGRCA